MTEGYIPLTPAFENRNDHARPVEYEQLQSEEVQLPRRSVNYSTESRTLNLPGGSFTIHSDGHTYSYAYGPKGVAGLKQNRYALLCAFFASIGGLEFGYDQGVVSTYVVSLLDL